MLEADADLQDALVQVADRVALRQPFQLQGLVLLEELAAVELLDAERAGAPAADRRSARRAARGRGGGTARCSWSSHSKAACAPADKSSVTATKPKYDVQVDWETVVPLGDTLSAKTDGRADDRWAKAFEVVLHEHQHRFVPREWGKIDFEYVTGEKQGHVVLYVRAIKPEPAPPTCAGRWSTS